MGEYKIRPYVRGSVGANPSVRPRTFAHPCRFPRCNCIDRPSTRNPTRAKKDFINLHDLLTRIAAATGDSYQDAARFLYQELLYGVLNDNDPQLYTYDEINGLQGTLHPNDLEDMDPGVDPAAEPFQIFAQCLKQAAENGIPSQHDEFKDDIPF
uniref:Uncharacterized protein n=2 Tax=Candidatus Kentrum sp. FM TaxID=2126340 RepID=A0A450SCH7_9GAMM|nr:MAG: hypothetical protein BECKFM1743C_GA0114222_100796 [Candidatus Kentron sp. FM]